MKLLERMKKEWEEYNPIRRKMIGLGLPLYFLMAFAPLFAMIPLMDIEEGKYAVLVGCLYLGWFFLLSTGMFIFTFWVNRKEIEIESARYNYFFKEPEKEPLNRIVVLDEELTYTLDDEGVRLEFPVEGGGQVFDEFVENAFYIPWERADFQLATQTHLKRIYFAVGVFSLDMDAPPFFIPLDEDVYAFMKKKCFDKALGDDWEYLHYNPKDAFGQIYKKGWIAKYRDKKNGEPFRKKE